MLASLFKTDLDMFDAAIVVAVAIFLLCAIVVRPVRGAGAVAWVQVLKFVGFAVFALAFLWMTP